MAKRTLFWLGLALAALLAGARAEAQEVTWPDGHDAWTEDFANAPDTTVKFTGDGPPEVPVEGDFQVLDLVFTGSTDYTLTGGSLDGAGRLLIGVGPDYTETLKIDTPLTMTGGAVIQGSGTVTLSDYRGGRLLVGESSADFTGALRVKAVITGQTSGTYGGAVQAYLSLEPVAEFNLNRRCCLHSLPSGTFSGESYASSPLYLRSDR